MTTQKHKLKFKTTKSITFEDYAEYVAISTTVPVVAIFEQLFDGNENWLIHHPVEIYQTYTINEKKNWINGIQFISRNNRPVKVDILSLHVKKKEKIEWPTGLLSNL